MNDGIQDSERQHWRKVEDERDKAQRVVLPTGHELVVRMKDGQLRHWTATLTTNPVGVFPVVLAVADSRASVVERATAVVELLAQALRGKPAE